MFGIRKVEICYQIFDVLRRADCEFVPASVISRVYDIKLGYLYEILSILCRKGILLSKKGPHGGYKHVKPVSLYSLFMWLAPAGVPKATEITNQDLAQHIVRLHDTLHRLTIKPKKLIPFDYPVEDAVLP